MYFPGVCTKGTVFFYVTEHLPPKDVSYFSLIFRVNFLPETSMGRTIQITVTDRSKRKIGSVGGEEMKEWDDFELYKFYPSSKT